MSDLNENQFYNAALYFLSNEFGGTKYMNDYFKANPVKRASFFEHCRIEWRSEGMPSDAAASWFCWESPATSALPSKSVPLVSTGTVYRNYHKPKRDISEDTRLYAARAARAREWKGQA